MANASKFAPTLSRARRCRAFLALILRFLELGVRPSREDDGAAGAGVGVGDAGGDAAGADAFPACAGVVAAFAAVPTIVCALPYSDEPLPSLSDVKSPAKSMARRQERLARLRDGRDLGGAVTRPLRGYAELQDGALYRTRFS